MGLPELFQRGTANVQWCEHVVSSHAYHDWISEWWNSWTNLAFVVAGAYGWSKAAEKRAYPSRSLPRSFWWTELTMFVIGMGSFLFHAHQSKAAEYSDELPMTVLNLQYLWCIDGVHPITRPPHRVKFYTIVGLATALTWWFYFFTHNYRVFEYLFFAHVFTLLILSHSAGKRLLPSNYKWWWSLALLVPAKGAWDLERYRYGTEQCHTTGTLWLHPVWHVGSALAHAFNMSHLADLARAQNLSNEMDSGEKNELYLQVQESHENNDNKKDK